MKRGARSGPQKKPAGFSSNEKWEKKNGLTKIQCGTRSVNRGERKITMKTGRAARFDHFTAEDRRGKEGVGDKIGRKITPSFERKKTKKGVGGGPWSF